ncbi:MAG: hypothetical protein AAF714_06480 [Pseudomonadota bacterium]
MMRLTDTQLQSARGVRSQASYATIIREVEEQRGTSEGGEANVVAATRIAEFCDHFQIRGASNLRAVSRVFLELGPMSPDARDTIPLRRRGFSEDERVAAFVHWLQARKARPNL